MAKQNTGIAEAFQELATIGERDNQDYAKRTKPGPRPANIPTRKTTFNLPLTTYEQLQELAHARRSTMKDVLVDLIDEAS